MIPDPLHPAIVHFPIALALVAPLVAAGAAWAIHTQRLRRAAWLGVVILQAAVVGSGWLALETGEREEERAERVVAERHIESHEEAAQRFVWLAGLTLALAAAGLLASPAGGAARALALAASLAVVAAVAAAGHSGGELVYRHGAAAAYASAERAVAPADRGSHSDDD
jgi:uncharacterized membrane protein